MRERFFRSEPFEEAMDVELKARARGAGPGGAETRREVLAMLLEVAIAGREEGRRGEEEGRREGGTGGTQSKWV